MKPDSKKPRKRLRGWGWVMVPVLLAAGAWMVFGGAPTAEDTPMPSPVPASAATPAPTEGRTAREIGYDKDIAALTALIEAEGTDPQTRADASARLTRLVAQHQTELALEAALAGAGYAPALVICQNESLTVMLASGELTAADSAAVLALCAAHADVALENIRVMAGAR